MRPLPYISRLNTEFQVLETLGTGAFSRVFRAINRYDGTQYAIKRSRHPVRDDTRRAEWLQEVQAMAVLRGHPNVVTMYSAWAEQEAAGDVLFIAMELCGAALSVHVNHAGADTAAASSSAAPVPPAGSSVQPMPEAQLLQVAKQITSALQHMHSHGLVHLDVKPDNIYNCGGSKYKLGDFGLATMRSGKWRVAEGDSRYLPLELLQGHHGQLDKADVFCLGASLYELATAQPLPSGGASYQRLRQGKIVLLPGLSNNFQNTIKAMISEHANQRPSADQILKMLEPRQGTLSFTSSLPRP